MTGVGAAFDFHTGSLRAAVDQELWTTMSTSSLSGPPEIVKALSDQQPGIPAKNHTATTWAAPLDSVVRKATMVRDSEGTAPIDLFAPRNTPGSGQEAQACGC